MWRHGERRGIRRNARHVTCGSSAKKKKKPQRRVRAAKRRQRMAAVVAACSIIISIAAARVSASNNSVGAWRQRGIGSASWQLSAAGARHNSVYCVGGMAAKRGGNDGA